MILDIKMATSTILNNAGKVKLIKTSSYAGTSARLVEIDMDLVGHSQSRYHLEFMFKLQPL